MSMLARFFASALGAAVPALASQAVFAQGVSDAAQSYSADARGFSDSFIDRTGMQSTTARGAVTVGAQLPDNLRFQAIDGHPRFRGHRYVHVNNNHLIVDGRNQVVAIHRHH